MREAPASPPASPDRYSGLASRPYYVRATSQRAPIFPDTSEHLIAAQTPAHALAYLDDEYDHPAGLLTASAWLSADDRVRGDVPLARVTFPVPR